MEAAAAPASYLIVFQREQRQLLKRATSNLKTTMHSSEVTRQSLRDRDLIVLPRRRYVCEYRWELEHRKKLQLPVQDV